MSEYSRLRRQQLIREAEGYLEFMTFGDERQALSAANRERLGSRALAVLAQLDPKTGQRAHATFLTGLVYRAMGRFSEAIEPLLASSKLDPSNVHIWLSLGWCYKRIQRVDLAIDALQEALRNGGAEAIVHYNLACYWSLLGNVRSAVRELAQAFELDAEYREQVAGEADFDPIRSHPDFLSLVSSVIV